MLTFIILVLFIITQTIKIINSDWLDSNLVFYLMLFTLVLGMMHLVRNTFNLGYCNCNDETKVEFFFAIKAFFIVFICLHYYHFNTFFDVDLEKAHDQVVERINHVVALFHGRLSLPYEFTYCFLGSCAALLSFCAVKINIQFGYYFYVINRNTAYIKQNSAES